MDSLLPISFPSLNSTNFAKSLNEVFVNIESNFKKLSNLGLNQGAPGKSCMYLPINLAAAFLYNPFTQQDEAGDDYKLFAAWLKALDDSKTGDPDWKACLDQIEASVKADFNQFASITHLDEAAYGRIAATLIWGHPYAFNNGTPAPGSLTGTLHTKYEIREGAATFEGKTLYGNWMYELYRVKGNDNTERISKYLDMFKTHVSICPPGKITVAFTPDAQSADIYPVGSFEYWYIDPRYRCGEQIKSTRKGSSDISCVLRWTTDVYNQTKWDGHFEVLEIFPTIQVGKDGKYYWFINGLNTGIPVTGEAGKDGKPAQMVVVERIENVRGWTPERPNGYEYWSPKSGTQTIRALLESGVPSRVRMGFEQALKNRLNVDSATPLDSSIIAGSDKSTDLQTKVISFDHTEANAWLPDDVQLENMSNQHLYRIFRVVGRDKFWTGNNEAKPNDSVLATDEYDRLYDPSCDEYYLEKGASCINEAQSIQAYIQELDGAFAIVLPGPAFKQDRTDTTFWFATLRAVPYKYLNNGDTIWQLVAFCSQNTQNTTQLDEHSQAGMMHRFDAFSYKKSSDSRNKPRGLMLPIGSAECASKTASDTWAAHIIHSDTGGFLEPVDINIGGSLERRGIQNVRLNVSATGNATAANDTSRPANGLSETNTMGAGQFISVFDKRILHVGSVNDFRALNFVNDAPDTDSLDNPTGTMNGAVPGRKARGGEGQFGLGTSNFFGQLSDGWFYGTELHVDEPVTITRYRDLMAVGRLLDVEGDVIVGSHIHKNFPNIAYGTRGGGIWVRSSLTGDPRTAKMLKEGSGSIFTEDMLNGNIKLQFEPYIRKGENLTTDGNDEWNNHISRFGKKANRGKFESSTNALKTPGKRNDDNPLFSAFFEDTLGSRVLVAEDGIVIYDPDKNCAMFSVDAFGNIQTYAREVRSNAIDTAWYFHTKWPNDGIEYEFNKVHDGFWKALGVEGTTAKPVPATFKVPAHNQLVIASDHEIQFMDWGANKGTSKSLLFSRYWRGSNAIKNGDSLYNANYWHDPSMYPAGYFHTFGFAGSDGGSHPTFPDRFGLASEARTWGSSEYLPTILSLPLDLAWVWGGQLVTGINPRAFDRTFDGPTYRMRAGSTITYGQVIHEPLRGQIGSISRKFDFATYKGNDLTIGYSYQGELEKLDADTMGDSAKAFNNYNSAQIGSWNMHGSVIEGALFVGGDFLAYQSASIRGQVRAKSFRRHINSLNEGSEWAFMLDNGKSSYAAPKHIGTRGCTCVNPGFRGDNQTPLVLDLGETFGSKRLVRFGTAETVTLDETDKIVVGAGGSDRKICLLGRYPDVHEIASGTFTGLFKGKTDNPGRWIMFSDGRMVTINFEISLNYYAKVGKSGSFWRQNRQYSTYGIAVYDNNGNLTANSTGGLQRNGLGTNFTTAVDLGRLVDKFNLPPFDIDTHIQALKQPSVTEGSSGFWQNWGGGGCHADAWGDGDTDAQYGITFRLTHEGQLKIARACGAALMVTTPDQTLSFSFTYPCGNIFPENKVPAIAGNSPTEAFVYKDLLFCLKQSAVIKTKPDSEGDEKELDVSNGLPWENKSAAVERTIQPTGMLGNIDDTNIDDLVLKVQNDEYSAIIIASYSGPASSAILGKHYTAWDNAEIENLSWSLFATESDFEDDSYAKRYVSISQPFATATLDESVFAGSAMNGDFLSEKIGINGSVPAGTKQNSWDLTVEKTNGLCIVTLRVAIDRKEKTGQNARVAGIKVDDKFCSKYELRNRKTYASLKSVDPNLKGPKYDLHYYWPGLKAVNTSDKGAGKGDWQNGSNKGKGLEGDGDKQDQASIVLALKPNGEIWIERCVNPGALTDGRAYSVNGDQPYVMARWIYPDEDATGGSGLVVSRLYAWSTNPNGDNRTGLSLTSIEPSQSTPYIWCKTIKLGSAVTDTNSELWANAGWELFATYVEPQTPSTDLPNDSSNDNWIWANLADPNTTTLKNWLTASGRETLNDAIIVAFDADSDYAETFVAPYGQATLKRSGSTVDASLWVTATGPSGLTHRSINFTANKSGSSYTISNLNSILLKKQTNPGYYKSTDRNGNTPSGTVEYLGTSQTEGSSSTWPYIWYSVDGETCELIDYPITLDPNYIYVLCTARGSTNDNPSVSGAPTHQVPTGFMCTFKGSTGTDADLNIFNGKSLFSSAPVNVLTSTWPRTVDASGAPINERKMIDALGGKTAIAGYARVVPGFTECYRVHTSNWTEAGRRIATNWEPVSIPGMTTRMTWRELSNYNPEVIRQSLECWWVDANGNYIQKDSENAVIMVSTFTGKKLGEFRNWLSMAFNHYLTGGSWGLSDWKARKEAKYSQHTGWTGLWELLTINQVYGFGYINMGTETSQQAPESDTGAGAGCLLKCQMHSDIQYGNIQIRGNISMDIGGFDRTGEVSGAKYLTSAFNNTPNGGYWPSGMSSEMAYRLSIPKIYNLNCDLIVQGDNKLYKVRIVEKDNRFDCVEVGTGASSGGASYDDTALKNRIVVLENMIRTISTTPDIITVNVPAGQTSVDIEITEKDVSGNAISAVDPLTIKTESGLTHNG